MFYYNFSVVILTHLSEALGLRCSTVHVLWNYFHENNSSPYPFSFSWSLAFNNMAAETGKWVSSSSTRGNNYYTLLRRVNIPSIGVKCICFHLDYFPKKFNIYFFQSSQLPSWSYFYIVLKHIILYIFNAIYFFPVQSVFKYNRLKYGNYGSKLFVFHHSTSP